MAQVQDQREIPTLQGLGLPDALVRAIRRLYGIAYDLRDQVRTQHIYSLAYQTTAQSIPNAGAPTKLTFQTNTYTTDPLHAAGTGDFIATIPGLYLATAQISWAANATGTYRTLAGYINGAVPVSPNPVFTATVAPSSGTIELNLSFPVFLKRGDAVQFMAVQDGGGSINTNAGHTWGALTLLVKQSG